jgi:Tol biopolymer transport system component
MNADGTDIRAVGEHHVERFDWSPDGKWFAFAATVNGQRDIFVMDAAGGELLPVTDDDQAVEQDVRWR